MNRSFYILIFCCIFIFSSCKNEVKEEQSPVNEIGTDIETTASQSRQEPWTDAQLLEPRDLAQIVKTSTDSLVIFSLGAGGIIPGSKDTGASGEEQNLENLRQELEDLPKDAEIVVYCGCCPFNICPNVRPAFSLLNEMGFENHRLLNLPENIKVDWIDKGYPVGS